MNTVTLTDVTLRDGLQMESRQFSLDEKATLFSQLMECGYSRLELTSFVNPKWIPQFSDADAFCQKIFHSKTSATSYPELMAFIPNEKGLDRMLPYPIDWASCFIATSDTFNKKNVNQTSVETLGVIENIIRRARAEKRKVRVYVSTVFGCPYEGAIAKAPMMELLKKIADLGPDEVALSDTIGVAVASQVKDIVPSFLSFFPAERTALHFHNTYGLAVAASIAGFECGVRKFDGTTGGIGGCPYAKGATGNAATEELAYSFFRQGQLPEFRWSAISAVLRTLKQAGTRVNSHLFDILEKGGSLYAIK